MVTPNDLIFLLETIHFSGGINGRKRLQKTICVLKHRDNISLEFNYVPYFYGPYSEELADSIKSLVGAGYLDEQADEIGIGVYQYNYTLTDEGRRVIQPILNGNLPIYDTTPEEIQNRVNQIDAMELDELVRYSKTLELTAE